MSQPSSEGSSIFSDVENLSLEEKQELLSQLSNSIAQERDLSSPAILEEINTEVVSMPYDKPNISGTDINISDSTENDVDNNIESSEIPEEDNNTHNAPIENEENQEEDINHPKAPSTIASSQISTKLTNQFEQTIAQEIIINLMRHPRLNQEVIKRKGTRPDAQRNVKESHKISKLLSSLADTKTEYTNPFQKDMEELYETTLLKRVKSGIGFGQGGFHYDFKSDDLGSDFIGIAAGLIPLAAGLGFAIPIPAALATKTTKLVGRRISDIATPGTRYSRWSLSGIEVLSKAKHTKKQRNEFQAIRIAKLSRALLETNELNLNPKNETRSIVDIFIDNLLKKDRDIKAIIPPETYRRDRLSKILLSSLHNNGNKKSLNRVKLLITSELGIDKKQKEYKKLSKQINKAFKTTRKELPYSNKKLQKEARKTFKNSMKNIVKDKSLLKEIKELKKKEINNPQYTPELQKILIDKPCADIISKHCWKKHFKNTLKEEVEKYIDALPENKKGKLILNDSQILELGQKVIQGVYSQTVSNHYSYEQKLTKPENIKIQDSAKMRMTRYIRRALIDIKKENKKDSEVTINKIDFKKGHSIGRWFSRKLYKLPTVKTRMQKHEIFLIKTELCDTIMEKAEGITFDRMDGLNADSLRIMGAQNLFMNEIIATSKGDKDMKEDRKQKHFRETTRREILQVNSRLNHLENEVAEVKTEVAEVKTEVAEVKTEVAKIPGQLQDMEERMSKKITTAMQAQEERMSAVIATQIAAAMKAQEERNVAAIEAQKEEMSDLIASAIATYLAPTHNTPSSPSTPLSHVDSLNSRRSTPVAVSATPSPK